MPLDSQSLPAPRRDFSALGELSVLDQPAQDARGHSAPSEVMYPGGAMVDGGLLAPGDPLPENAGPGGRRPEWLKVRIGAGATYAGLKQLIHGEGLHTVCEEARCPNMGECWTLGTATFMILGSVCTRNCGFCAIETGRPPVTDWDEPRRVAEATSRMGLKHVVVTMVARDDLPDGGAGMVAETIRQVRTTIFGLETPGLGGGAREEVMALVREMEPVVGVSVHVSFEGPVDSVVSARALAIACTAAAAPDNVVMHGMREASAASRIR